MKQLTIEIWVPHVSLSPNWRGHWAVKSKRTKEQRGWASAFAATAMSAAGSRRQPKHKRATVSIQWFTKTIRHPDGDNALSSLKAAFDGVTDSGFLADDRGLTHQPIQFAKDAKNPRVVLTFTAL